MADILQTIERYRALGIDQQIDYKKFYLYSIITHSTAMSLIGTPLKLRLTQRKKARFTEGDGEQIGTITYIFKLN